MTSGHVHEQRFARNTIGALLVVFLTAAASPAHALFSLEPPQDLTFLVRSELAEADGDGAGATAWAESLAVSQPASAFGCARVATLYEAMGQDVEALSWGERAVARDSLCLEAAMLVGRMHLRSGESDIAAQVLTPPLRQLGAPPEAYALRALAHELSHRYDAALADLKRTDSLLPDFAWIATGILSLALEDGRLEEAREALQLALELKPDDPRALRLGVDLARRAGDPVLAETLLRALALQADATPKDVAAYGACLLHAGKDHAFSQLTAWVEAKGTMTAAQLRAGVGQSLIQDGLFHEAIRSVKPLHGNPIALPIRARAYVSLGEERKALDCYRKLLPKRSVSREESLVVAYLEIHVGDRVRGVETLERARASALVTPRQVLAASLCYSVLGFPEETVALIRQSESAGVTSAAIYEELGSAASELGDSLVAQWAFERMRDLGKETSECLYFFAATDVSRGRTRQAMATLERAIALDPRNGRALLLLGALRFQAGQLESAREILRDAAGCPGTAGEANQVLAKVCRSLHLDSEARQAESRARSGRSRPAPGLTFFQAR
ncbi:MAG TPA: tetratricopeptide repeat protein [Candidatus Eisenbacteria bacterium]